MHEIAYILEQFQQSAQGWSSDAGAFFAWLNRYLVGAWSEPEEHQLPPGVVRPARAADGVWNDSASEVPDEIRRGEWWLEGEKIVGILRYAESMAEDVLFSFYRFPCAALALFRLATWYCGQRPPEPAQFQLPASVLATAFVPDRKTRDSGDEYALVQIGHYQYVLHLGQPYRQDGRDFLLDGTPVTFVERRLLREMPLDSYANEHGHLYFDDPIQAMSWFIEHYTWQSGGYLLTPQEGERKRDQQGGTSLTVLPDLGKMRLYQAELEADARERTLSEAERQERIAFLMRGVAQIRQATAHVDLKRLSEGIQQLLSNLEAKRQRPLPQTEEEHH